MRLFFNERKSNPKWDICYLCSHHPPPIWMVCFSYSIIMPFFQSCAFHVIFLIFCFLLVIDDIPIKRILLRFRYDIYPIINICLSISYQFFCRIELVYFWVHLNAISTCVIIMKISWPPIFQDIITNHASGCILVFRNFLNPGCTFQFISLRCI